MGVIGTNLANYGAPPSRVMNRLLSGMILSSVHSLRRHVPFSFLLPRYRTEHRCLIDVLGLRGRPEKWIEPFDGS